MEIEQFYNPQQQQLISCRQSQQNDLRRCVQDVSQLDNSVPNLIEWLEANYQNLRQICSLDQTTQSKQETEEQIMIRIIKDQLSRASQQQSMNLNFCQLDVQPALMERLIFSINQLSHLKEIKINLSRQKWGHEQLQVLCNQLIMCRTLRNLELNLGFNSIGDKGHQILTETLSNLHMLESININLERCGLQRRSISILEIFNYLKSINDFQLNLDGNLIEIEDEMKAIIPKFKSENIFTNLQIFKIRFNEYQPKYSNEIQNTQQINGNNSNQQNLYNQQSANANFVAQSQQNQINQSVHPNHSQLDFNQQQNQSSNIQQQQQMQALQQNIALQQQQLQQLCTYAQQMVQRGFPQNHPQYLQIAAQIQQLQASIKQNMHLSKQLQTKATAIKKKSVISRLLEIMLKFTYNLEEFSLACPGQLIDSACWEYFAELIKAKAEKLKKFDFAGLNSNTKSQDMEYFFYQMAKLKNLTDLSLSFHNLQTQSCLHLERFLKPLTKLEHIHIDLSSPDSSSNQRDLFQDLSNFINNTESQNIKSLDLNISNSSFDLDLALPLFQGIAKLRNLASLKLNMQSCKQACDKTIQLLCQALLYQKNIKSLQIDAAYSSFTPISIQYIMQTLVVLKDSLISLQLNLTNRGEGFTNFNNNLINDTVGHLQNLKKCVISSARNPKISLYRQKAQEVNRMIKLCHLMKATNPLQNFRKEVSFEVLQYLSQ
ncbi:hypothetical protein TTHERM_00190890 (macronuclear) [Tetrahymena thermophila SB210]|uniref:Kinase domain protein n=1 Tax=Tetrahymena thermophila (strain SB210) TaxID=312017 RepID=I7LV07_TETTS|nr:hypothetical protein TTHERM_00190890 [Tetrahymena thermophila SB210]EAR96421.1 hypothetical protein TTHERM_00190890 [Tetrahymena thermophila SB210]|eukprot:XP_001016666.1 hypothetical protein TTHERM_00190890 [Tetrahymena thermophila SB210]